MFSHLERGRLGRHSDGRKPGLPKDHKQHSRETSRRKHETCRLVYGGFLLRCAPVRRRPRQSNLHQRPMYRVPVLEWRPPKDWYKVHKRVLETLEDITGMKATWNRCMSCPVRLSAAAPKDDHLSVLSEAIIRSYLGDKVQVEHIEPLVLVVSTMISSFTRMKEESAIGTCCECLNLFNPPRFHRPQIIIPTPDAASNEVNF
jgi:hypothetical protein